jgi:hypothetical protein
MCRTHYGAWSRGTYDPKTDSDTRRWVVGQPFEERLARSVEVGDCWEWTGAKINGYGSIGLSNPTRHRLVHRWVWETLVGPIRQGLELDHRCRNHACCNPDHLEPVTKKINQERGAKNWTTGPCKHGHPATSRRRTAGGQTYCADCRSAYQKRRRSMIEVKEVR